MSHNEKVFGQSSEGFLNCIDLDMFYCMIFGFHLLFGACLLSAGIFLFLLPPPGIFLGEQRLTFAIFHLFSREPYFG